MPIPRPCPRHRRPGLRRGSPRAPRRALRRRPRSRIHRANGASSASPIAPPEEPRRRRRIPRLRTHAINLLWALLAAAVPWAWFLVRDLGSVTQLIALAIPVLVAAAFVGLAISAVDERKLSTLVVAVSVAAFGWVTILGPRGRAALRSARWRPMRVASMAVDGTTGDADAVLRSSTGSKADLAVDRRAVEEGPQRDRCGRTAIPSHCRAVRSSCCHPLPCASCRSRSRCRPTCSSGWRSIVRRARSSSTPSARATPCWSRR